MSHPLSDSLRTGSQLGWGEKGNRGAKLARRGLGEGGGRLSVDATHWPTCNLLSCNTYVSNMPIRLWDRSNTFFTLECISFNNICMHLSIFLSMFITHLLTVIDLTNNGWIASGSLCSPIFFFTALHLRAWSQANWVTAESLHFGWLTAGSTLCKN